MVLRNMTTQSDHDARTPEERLLSKKRLGSFYLDDVRALIAERDNALRLAGSDYEECATERDIARGRAEAAEAEVRRLTEGLRDIEVRCESEMTSSEEQAEFAWGKARDLLANSPDGAKPEGGEA